MTTHTNTLLQTKGAGETKDYRFDRFRLGLILDDMKFSKKSLRPGDPIPRFDLLATDGSQFQLDEYAAGRPVLLVTGSVTCPMTAASTPDLKSLYEKYGETVAFVLLYVREGHPGEHTPQPKTMEDKLQHARALQEIFGVNWPVAVDDIDGSLHRALDAKPNSLHLVDARGMIVFRSLWAGDTNAVERAVGQLVRGENLTGTESKKMVGPVVRSGGYITEVLKTGGEAAIRDAWLAAPPMILLGQISSLFSFAPKARRGQLAAATLAAIGLVLTTIITVAVQ